MLFKFARYAAKLTATTFIVGWLTYANHHSINRFISGVRFYFAESETGFVKKEHSFDLRFSYELNGRSNLETYVNNYTAKLPVYIRSNGILIGSAEYNASNFISEELAKICSAKPNLESKLNTSNNVDSKKKKFLKTVLDLVGE